MRARAARAGALRGFVVAVRIRVHSTWSLTVESSPGVVFSLSASELELPDGSGVSAHPPGNTTADAGIAVADRAEAIRTRFDDRLLIRRVRPRRP
ncbi:hypothetical protein [Embleya sp. NPDC005575]|uniref:hypothetical protein n=1 Tax=Embleya sp. NPDC005575 TaxID=3156892 RepID=UPI0033A1F425